MINKIEKILDDNKSGSFTIAKNALNYYRFLIKDTSSTSKNSDFVYRELQHASKVLIKKQPNMVILRKTSNNLLIYFKRLIKSDKELSNVLDDLNKKIDQIEEEMDSNLEKISQTGSRIIAHSNKIMTISNSSIVKKICCAAHNQKRKFEVYCLKSHPPDEGLLFAEELADHGIRTTVISDNEMGLYVPQMNLILLGADRLYENGFVNKVGTLPLCLTANHFRISVYLAVETMKILLESERAIKLANHKASEVYRGKNRGLSVENIYFEKTPLNLIHKVICEDGVFETSEFINWYLKE